MKEKTLSLSQLLTNIKSLNSDLVKCRMHDLTEDMSPAQVRNEALMREAVRESRRVLNEARLIEKDCRRIARGRRLYCPFLFWVTLSAAVALVAKFLLGLGTASAPDYLLCGVAGMCLLMIRGSIQMLAKTIPTRIELLGESYMKIDVLLSSLEEAPCPCEVCNAKT